MKALLKINVFLCLLQSEMYCQKKPLSVTCERFLLPFSIFQLNTLQFVQEISDVIRSFDRNIKRRLSRLPSFSSTLLEEL